MKKTEVENEKDLDGAEANNPAAPDALVELEPGAVSQEQLRDLKERAAKAGEHWERLLRTTADFENFKKRAAREKQDAVKFANESLLQKLIPVLDNFDMALSAAQNTQTDRSQSLQTGINMIYQQLKNLLIETGLEEVDAAGKRFDPNLHEAVSQKETADTPEDHVVEQLRKGYKLRERLLRPASVIVAKTPAGSPPAANSAGKGKG